MHMQQSQKTEDVKEPAPRHAGQTNSDPAKHPAGSEKDAPTPKPITDWAGF